MRISDWSSDVCSSDLQKVLLAGGFQPADEIGLELGKRGLHALITMGSRRIHHCAQQRGRAFRLWRQAVMQAFRQLPGCNVGHDLSPLRHVREGGKSMNITSYQMHTRLYPLTPPPVQTQTRHAVDDRNQGRPQN